MDSASTESRIDFERGLAGLREYGRSPLEIALVYLAVGCLRIAVTDGLWRALLVVETDVAIRQSLKGLSYVVLTAVVAYVGLTRIRATLTGAPEPWGNTSGTRGSSSG